MMNIIDYNEFLAAEYEKTKSIDVLERYIMSETLPPIEDYTNVMSLIRKNYTYHTNATFLIIGAHLASYWPDTKENDFLAILNAMINFLPNEIKAVVYYLNAYQIFCSDSNYKENPEYRANLLASTAIDTPFVYNHRDLARISTGDFAKQQYEAALQNVIHVPTMQELEAMTLDDWLSPQSFIDEFILGTHLSPVVYESLKEDKKW